MYAVVSRTYRREGGILLSALLNVLVQPYILVALVRLLVILFKCGQLIVMRKVI
jgi:hypothetical protein